MFYFIFFTNKHILIEEPFFCYPIRKHHFSLSMLHPLLPSPFIHRAIYPFHCSITFSFILIVISFVYISRLPFISSKSMFLILVKLSDILIWVYLHFILSPLTFTVLHSKLKFSRINSPIRPKIGSLAMRFTVHILTYKRIPSMEYICSCTMFKTIWPLSFISISVLANMNTLAMCFWVFPFSNVWIPIKTLPHSITFF